MISPIYDELATSPQYKKVVFLKVDVDEVKEITQRYQIRSMPTFLFLKENQIIDRFSGANIELLKSTIGKNLS
jgi:thioredoxin 1